MFIRRLHIALSTVLWVVALAFSGSVAAQFRYDEQPRYATIETGYYSALDLSGIGGVFRHGATLNGSYTLINKYRTKIQRRTQINRVIDRDILVEARFTTFRRNGLHQALQVQTGPGFRLTLPEGLYFQFGAALGYLRQIYPGRAYVFDSSSLTSDRRSGANYFTIDGSAGFGWSFQKSHDYPVQLFLRGGLMTWFPDNGAWLLQPYFQGGIGWVIARNRQSYS